MRLSLLLNDTPKPKRLVSMTWTRTRTMSQFPATVVIWRALLLEIEMQLHSWKAGHTGFHGALYRLIPLAYSKKWWMTWTSHAQEIVLEFRLSMTENIWYFPWYTQWNPWCKLAGQHSSQTQAPFQKSIAIMPKTITFYRLWPRLWRFMECQWWFGCVRLCAGSDWPSPGRTSSAGWENVSRERPQNRISDV